MINLWLPKKIRQNKIAKKTASNVNYIFYRWITEA